MWFHGLISKEEAEALLSGGDVGSYLVRFSTSARGSYAVSKRVDGKNKVRFRYAVK